MIILTLGLLNTKKEKEGVDFSSFLCYNYADDRKVVNGGASFPACRKGSPEKQVSLIPVFLLFLASKC